MRIVLLVILLWGVARADPLPLDLPTPFPDDPRCGHFAFDRRMPLIPAARPQVRDPTVHGEMVAVVDALAATLAADLELSGAFTVVSGEPSGPELWDSDLAFDYLGWYEAGASLVIGGEVRPDKGDLVRVRLWCRLTEEADTLRIGGAEAVLRPERVATFAHRYVNALVQCITGVPGAFGTRIVYARRTGPGQPKEIWMTEFGSNEQVQISHDGVIAMLPAWGPGGSIAWTGYRSGDPDLYITRCDGCKNMVSRDGPYVFSARPGLDSGVAFSPDGTFAAITLVTLGNSDVWLLDGHTGEEVARLTDSPAIDASATWSPDGQQIAFVSDRLGFPQVFVMKSDGRDQHPLPLPGSYNTSPDWSPDGTEIAYQARGMGSPFSIWSFDLTTGSARRLTSGPWEDEEPSWSPDGRAIVFTSTRQGGRKLLYVMSRSGSGVRVLFRDGGDYYTPAWERTFVR